MNKFRFTINVLAIAIFTLAFASFTQAQATRTWVSGVGDDVNPCSRTAPCKTFAGAISKTAQGGEIDVLDPGGFGTLTITKAITIDGSGTLASILNSAGVNGINVNAQPNDIVTIRGLSFQGARQGTSPGGDGIKFNSGKGLNVINCIILNQGTNGIEVSLSAAGSFVYVLNTVVKNCAGDGFSAFTSTGLVAVSIQNSSFIENGTGLRAKGNSRISIDRSNFSNNTAQGVFSDGTTGVGVADLSNSEIFGNGGAGVQAQTGGAVARINNCDIKNNNGTGALVGAGGEIDTWGNNRIFSNGGDGCVSCTAKGTS